MSNPLPAPSLPPDSHEPTFCLCELASLGPFSSVESHALWLPSLAQRLGVHRGVARVTCRAYVCDPSVCVLAPSCADRMHRTR